MSAHAHNNQQRKYNVTGVIISTGEQAKASLSSVVPPKVDLQFSLIWFGLGQNQGPWSALLPSLQTHGPLSQHKTEGAPLIHLPTMPLIDSRCWRSSTLMVTAGPVRAAASSAASLHVQVSMGKTLNPKLFLMSKLALACEGVNGGMMRLV